MKQMKTRKQNSLSVLFLVFFVPFFWAKLIRLTTLIDYNEINIVCGIIIKVFGVLNLCLLLLCKIPKRKLFSWVVCFLIVIVSGFLSDDWQFIWTLGFIVTAYYCDFNRIAKIALLSYVMLLFMTFILSYTGIIVNTVSYSVTRTRYGMGFIFTSIGGIIISRIALLLIYLKRKKVSFLEILALVGLAIFYYMKTKTRTPLAIILVLVFIVYSAKWFEKIFKSNIWSKIVQYSVIVSPIIAFTTVILYDPSIRILNMLNILLSSRLSITQRTIAADGISLIGQRITTIGTGSWTTTGEVIEEAGWLYNVVDSSYILYAMKYGVLFLLIVIVLYYFACKRSLEIKDTYLQIVLVILIFYGIVEPQLFKIEYNPFLLILGTAFFKKEISFNKQTALMSVKWR